MPVALPERPIGFAHRGARAECPDNTLVSFARALELGARAVETDAWLTADHVVVLDHDGWVRRRGRRREICDLAHDDLPPHVPRLVDLYVRCGTEVEVSIDVKDPEEAGAVLAVARDAGASARLWLCSADVRHLTRWRAMDPDVHLVHSTSLRSLIDTRRARRPLGPVAVDTVAGHARSLRARGIEVVNLHQQQWSAPLVAAVQGSGCLAFAWDAQTPGALARLMDLGVDAVYSDHVGLMVEVLTRFQEGDPRPGS